MKVEKILYVKCHTMGRSLCERRSHPRYGIASATALRWIHPRSLCAVFLLPKSEKAAYSVKKFIDPYRQTGMRAMPKTTGKKRPKTQQMKGDF